MRFEYKEMNIELEGIEVYWLCDLLLFALDYDAENGHQKLTDEKRNFANKLINATKDSNMGV